VFPGLVLSGLYIAYIGIACLIRPDWAPQTGPVQPDGEAPLLPLVLRSFLRPVILIVLVLGSIFFGLATPTEAAGVGAFGAMVLAALNRRLGLATLKEIVDRSAQTTAMVFAIFIGATAFSYVFRSLGGETLIEDMIATLALGPFGVLVLFMGFVFVLGFFFEWLEIILIVLPLAAPIVGSLDFGAHIEGPDVMLWFAMLVAVNLQTSFLTPPFGFALFYLKGVAPPEVTLAHLYRGIIPFVVLQLVGLGLVLGFPGLVTWLPEQAYR
jgi:tripartite ATP-independent transporter DctM subunit